jgi:hypothetical protein
MGTSKKLRHGCTEMLYFDPIVSASKNIDEIETRARLARERWQCCRESSLLHRCSLRARSRTERKNLSVILFEG